MVIEAVYIGSVHQCLNFIIQFRKRNFAVIETCDVFLLCERLNPDEEKIEKY